MMGRERCMKHGRPQEGPVCLAGGRNGWNRQDLTACSRVLTQDHVGPFQGWLCHIQPMNENHFPSSFFKWLITVGFELLGARGHIQLLFFCGDV